MRKKIDYIILVQKQQNLKGKIPENKFNKVNDFLNDIHKDIQSHGIGSQIWTPQNKAQPHAQQIRQERFQHQYHDRLRPQIHNQKDYQNQNQNQQSNQYRQLETNQYRQPEESSEIDPYKLYGFNKNQKINLSELKEKYKTYAIQTHPDKNNGNMKNFQIVTNAYKKLMEIYKTQQDDKQYTELKNSSLSYLEEQSKTNKRNTNLIIKILMSINLIIYLVKTVLNL